MKNSMIKAVAIAIAAATSATAALLLTTGTASAQTPEKLHTIRIDNFSQMQDYFRYEEGKPMIISGHRGGMLPGYPENSIEAMEKTLTFLPSFFEIDPQMTKDSVIILMHDATFDRTTNLSGRVSDYTYAELKDVRLKDRQGSLTDIGIPTLEEALEWGKDKTIFNLDNKRIPWNRYVDLFKDGRYQNIVLSVRSMEEALYYYERLDQVMLCVAIHNQSDLDDFIETGIPFNRIMAYVGYSIDPEHSEVYSFLRRKGVMCFIAIAPTADKNPTDLERVKAYSEEMMKKPDIIETDYPSLFVNK
ncbi:MAG TPA: glycerophosphodiester phosphodiesterase family protein [Sphingobacteriaceae bacterium]|nr:glycerophosphodiester phosphodiesterase family protein [Sphingobacteriaceae bacterium]